MNNQEAATDVIPGAVDSHNNLLWGAWATTGFGCLIGLVLFILQFVLVIIYIGIKFVSSPPSDIVEFQSTLLTDGLLLAVSIFVVDIAGLALIALIIKIKNGYSIAEYLGFRRISIKTSLYMVPLAAVFMLVAYLVSYIPGRTDDSFFIEMYHSTAVPALLWIDIAVLAPLLEEIFFRGFVFVSFRQSRIGVAGTIIITAFIWALLHLGQYDIFDIAAIFIFGIILGAVRQKTGSLWPPLILHSIYNLVVIIMVALS